MYLVYIKFAVHDKFINGADEKMLKVKEAIRRLKEKNSAKSKKRNFKKRKKSPKFPDFIFVGIHIR